ncbi:uncharacterized protein LOC125671120 [Ostrea edulis]|uniref:uncharacterized protein LOC125671120 n=1 Tax=Ostrea edulis TaxID=37623 RepID=UPI0024AEAA8C|nr:uncharacterized protein LOC125671120 [Ostrea edulis]
MSSDGSGKRYGPVNNPYAHTLRNQFEYLKRARRTELKFHASNNPGVTFMLFSGALVIATLYPMVKLRDRIDLVQKAYHCHYRVLRKEDADPKLKELGYYN